MALDPFLAPLLPTLPPMPSQVDDYPAFRAEQEAAADALVDQ
jgi:acetyl esterase